MDLGDVQQRLEHFGVQTRRTDKNATCHVFIAHPGNSERVLDTVLAGCRYKRVAELTLLTDRIPSPRVGAASGPPVSSADQPETTYRPLASLSAAMTGFPCFPTAGTVHCQP
ncbi:MAG: hypothetical protein QNJ03_14925 [Dinoroseobacter sp.]|nr:hypothetical protein [Dinoroseobacter sp.]